MQIAAHRFLILRHFSKRETDGNLPEEALVLSRANTAYESSASDGEFGGTFLRQIHLCRSIMDYGSRKEKVKFMKAFIIFPLSMSLQLIDTATTSICTTILFIEHRKKIKTKIDAFY